METYIEKSAPIKSTRNARSIVGLRVLAPSGEVVGRVREVRLHYDSSMLEGVIVGRGMGRAKLYLCKSYLGRISDDAVFLNIEPAVMHIGKKVISADGKVFGKVIGIHRVEQTNQIASILIKRRFFRKATAPFSQVKKIGDAVILRKTYAELCKRGS